MSKEKNNATFEDFDNSKSNEDSVTWWNPGKADESSDELTGAPIPKKAGDKIKPVGGIAAEDGLRNVTQLMTDDAKKIKKLLRKQPKVDFYIPLSPGEKLGQAYETVTINGYRLEIKKGMMVAVPQQVATMLAEHLNVQTSVGVDMRLENKSEDVKRALE